MHYHRVPTSANIIFVKIEGRARLFWCQVRIFNSAMIMFEDVPSFISYRWQFLPINHSVWNKTLIVHFKTEIFKKSKKLQIPQRQELYHNKRCILWRSKINDHRDIISYHTCCPKKYHHAWFFMGERIFKKSEV